jgi:hypothetical protein
MTNDKASFSEMLEHYQTISITTHMITSSYSLQTETHISLQDKYLKLYRTASKASCYNITTSSPLSVFFVKTLPLSLTECAKVLHLKTKLGPFDHNSHK